MILKVSGLRGLNLDEIYDKVGSKDYSNDF